MTSTLTPTCSFCGLAFANRPLLELHVREDHLPRGQRKDPGLSPGRDADDPDRREAQPAASSATKEVITTTSAPLPGRPRTGWAAAAMRRVAGAFRRAHAELLLVSEIMFRRPDASRHSRPASPPARQDGHPTATSGRAA